MTTTWDLRGEGIADLGASTIEGTGRTEGDDAYDYIDDALMSTICCNYYISLLVKATLRPLSPAH